MVDSSKSRLSSARASLLTLLAWRASHPATEQAQYWRCWNCDFPKNPASVQKCQICGSDRDANNGSILIDVTPEDIGVELEDGSLEVLIPKNTVYPTPVPTPYVKYFYTKEAGQREFEVIIRQGSSGRAEKDEYLGMVLVPLPPDLPRGAEITIALSLDSDGTGVATAQLREYPNVRATARFMRADPAHPRPKTAGARANRVAAMQSAPAGAPPFAEDRFVRDEEPLNMPPDLENARLEQVENKRRRRASRSAAARSVPAGAACFTGDCKQDAIGLCIQCGRPYCAWHGGREAGYGQRCRDCYDQMAHNLVEVHYLAGQLPEAAALLGSVDPASAPLECLYYRGLALAASGDFVAAEQCFQRVIARPGGDGDIEEASRQVLAKILSARAAQRLQANDIVGAADDLRQAVALSKDTSKQYSLLMALTLQAGFAYLQAGRFADALREWRETQAQEPQNLQVAHSLAVVCYRLASETEAQHTPENDTYWRDAIANWVMVIVSDSFWSAWGNGRTGALGPIEASIINEVREKTGSRLRDDFREFRTQYLADPSHSADAERHVRYEADFVREMHAAEEMMKAIQRGNPSECPVQVACGPLMLERWRQIPGAAGLVDAVNALSRVSPELRRYLSDLGAYYVMIHDLKRYDDAYTALEKMASGREKNAEAVALLVEAYLAQANELIEAQSFDRALPLLEKAAGHKRDQAMPPLVQVAIKLARALYDGDKIQQGIDLLERLMKAYSITDSEFKAELSRGYFERGLQRNKNHDNKGSLQDLRRAQEINPNNEQVKQNLVKAIMNLAVEEANADRLDAAFKLVMEVIVMLPDNLGEFREPISVVLFRHGIDMANKAAASVQYSSYKASACPALREARNQLQMALQFAPPDNYSYRANVQEQIGTISTIINRIC